MTKGDPGLARRLAEQRGILKPRRTYTVDQGGCPRCGHMVFALDRIYFCACEDCHPGGVLIRKG